MAEYIPGREDLLFAALGKAVRAVLEGKDPARFQDFCSSLDHGELATPKSAVYATLLSLRTVATIDEVSPIVYNAAMLSSLARACERLRRLRPAAWTVCRVVWTCADPSGLQLSSRARQHRRRHSRGH